MTEIRATNVYKLLPCEGSEWLQPINPDDYALLTFDGKPCARSWRPVAMKRLKDFGDGRPVRSVDFPCSSPGSHMPMTDAARDKIRAYLEEYGEFLPLAVTEGKFWTCHVSHFVDALDENASDVL